MSGFLYFIENAKTAPSELIDAAGLSHALEKGQTTTCQSTKGPGKKAGHVAAVAGTEAALIKYTPKRQTWTKIEAGGRRPETGGEPTASGLKPVVAWLGYYTDDPPGPMDLVRADAILDGYAVNLEGPAGTDKWFIPRARIYTEDIEAGGITDGPTSDLPQALSLVDGKMVQTPLPRYRQACLDAERIWAGVMAANAEDPPDAKDKGEDKTAELTATEEFEMTVRILGINYRIAVPEANALGIVTTISMTNIVKCFVDFPTYAKVQIDRAQAKKD